MGTSQTPGPANSNTSTTQTGGANPTPVPTPDGTAVIETGNGQPSTGGGTSPAGVVGTTVQQNDPAATGVANQPQNAAGQPGTGTTPASNDVELAEMQPAIAAQGELASSHMLVRTQDISVFRRLVSDFERGVEGADARLREALRRVF